MADKLEDIQARVQEFCEGRLAGRQYEGKHPAVLALIDETSQALSARPAGLGAWEALELDSARDAVRANFLTLALVMTNKAIEVSRLPEAEYHFGFNYGKR